MQISSRFHTLFRLGLLLAMLFAVQLLPARAQDSAFISISFGNQVFSTTTIGKSFPLDISIAAGANPIRGGSLQCTQTGTSLSASSISRLPNTVLISANQGFRTEQYYRGVSAGTTSVSCIFQGTDTVTGQLFSVTSNTESITVSSEQRLVVEAYSSTNNAAVGEAIYLRVLFNNRGPNTFNNVEVTCSQLGSGIAFISATQSQYTLPSGQSGVATYKLQGAFSGASGLFLCSVSATDSVTGEVITLNANAVPIRIR